MTIDQQINDFFDPIAKAVESVVFYSVPVMGDLEVSLILVWLGLAALFFTLYLGFANIRYLPLACKILKNDGLKTKGDGEISQFQALMASLSGTVGLGNISGVAIAISIGGPGAAIWMTIMGFLGMSSKFAEVMLGVKYRKHPDHHNVSRISGGPMYYLKEGFTKIGMAGVGKYMAILFAFCCMFAALGGGNMYQANQAFGQIKEATGGAESFLSDYGWAVGVVMAVFVALVVWGGIKSIASVASKIVPLMAAIYIIFALIVIMMHAGNVPSAFVSMIEGAFSLKAGLGAIIGGLLVGIQRAAFSNEAGLGSASIVQSTTNSDGPVGTGLVAMLGPIIDTVIICNVTALLIIVTGVYQDVPDGIAGVEMTSMAFEAGVPGFRYILMVSVILFAFSTMISWYYCGATCFRYVFGEKNRIENIFKFLFCLCVVIGSATELESIISLTDSATFSMALPNIIGLYLLAPEVRKDLKEYIRKRKNSEP